VEKQIAPATLDMLIPSMLLQPLIENSIKHGLSPKVGGGRIVIRSSRVADRALVEIEDNGLGMSEGRLNVALTDGIGLSNVDQRLRMIYGSNGRLTLTSKPGTGTVARIDIPVRPPQELLAG
jgi:two-component system, LytTR family, sensor kinase